MPTFAVASNFTAYLIYVMNGRQNGRAKQLRVNNQIDIIIIYQ
jgi:hypothetical protein